MRLHKLVLSAVTFASLLAIGVSASAAHAAALCVGSDHGCFSTVQAAVNVAHDRDTVHIAAGTFPGGVTIDRSIKLIGAGADATIISGGGPVLTVGVAGAPSEPTVTIDGVTVTGGNTIGNLAPSSGRGGGIYVPRAAGPSTGATVTIRNSVIRGNRVAPAAAIDSGIPCPGGSDCPFASAGGGGISNDGTMTLKHAVVRDNRADSASGLTSDADGGGILNRAFGTLTLKHSVVTDNHAEVTAPNGRFADGGGISMVAGTLTIDDSAVRNNNADVSTAFPSDVETAALAGGLHSQGSAPATIRNTSISGNAATASNLLGEATAFCGGLCTDGSLTLRDSTLSDNQVTATTAATSGGASADSGGAGIGCCQDMPTPVTVSGTRFIANRVSATAPAGVAIASAGAVSMANATPLTVSDSIISGNRVSATSTTGSAIVHGVGINNGGLLTLRNTTVSDNVGAASAPTGEAQGGGIWNGAFGPPPPAPELTLAGSAVTRNTLSASPGITRQGGGLFTTVPVTLKDSAIAHNVPDQCSGC